MPMISRNKKSSVYSQESGRSNRRKVRSGYLKSTTIWSYTGPRRMIFVDTGAWAGLFVPEDPLHSVARAWLQSNSDRLITSDYVVDELLTLLKTRFNTQSAISAGRALFAEDIATLIYLTQDDCDAAWKIFRTHADKGWSFTDCASFALMQRLRISTAFAFDRHFSEMRGIRRVPA